MELIDLLHEVERYEEDWKRSLKWKIKEIYIKIKTQWSGSITRDELFISLRNMTKTLVMLEDIKRSCVNLIGENSIISKASKHIPSSREQWQIKLDKKLKELSHSDEHGDTEARVTDELEYIIEALLDITQIEKEK